MSIFFYAKNREDNPFNKLTGDFSLQEKAGKSKVPKDMLFVMGDNRLKSKDSRTFGLVSYDSIIEK
jgi:signal peptidase I